MSDYHKLKIFAGSSNAPLAEKIVRHLGIELGKSRIVRFSDQEIMAEIGENVRNVDVYVIQSTSTPANEHLMELLVFLDALKRASAKSITAVIPYFGYARQDRKVKPRTPISAKLVADLLSTAGATRVISMDLHAGQIQGFFNVPFDHLFSMPVLLEHMRTHYGSDNIVIVSPDAGGVERARAFSKRLNATLAIIDKRREKPNEAKVMNIVGDVEGKTAVLIDDMIDTAGTISEAAAALTEKGAHKVICYCTHPVLSGPAVQRLSESKIENVVVTDSIPLSSQAEKNNKFTVLSIAPLLGEAIRRIHYGDSVSSLFV